MMTKIIYVTGGARSGKSRFAQSLSEQLATKQTKTSNLIYLATAYCWDTDFEQRIKRHQADRDENWRTIEETLWISQLALDNQIVLLDCITLWLTNIFYKNNYDLDKSLEFAEQEWNRFIKKPMTLVVVSNELGLGVHPETESARKFVDLQGWVNQYIAQTVDEAYLLVSGISNKIK